MIKNGDEVACFEYLGDLKDFVGPDAFGRFVGRNPNTELSEKFIIMTDEGEIEFYDYMVSAEEWREALNKVNEAKKELIKTIHIEGE